MGWNLFKKKDAGDDYYDDDDEGSEYDDEYDEEEGGAGYDHVDAGGVRGAGGSHAPGAAEVPMQAPLAKPNPSKRKMLRGTGSSAVTFETDEKARQGAGDEYVFEREEFNPLQHLRKEAPILRSRSEATMSMLGASKKIHSIAKLAVGRTMTKLLVPEEGAGGAPPGSSSKKSMPSMKSKTLKKLGGLLDLDMTKSFHAGKAEDEVAKGGYSRGGLHPVTRKRQEPGSSPSECMSFPGERRAALLVPGVAAGDGTYLPTAHRVGGAHKLLWWDIDKLCDGLEADGWEITTFPVPSEQSEQAYDSIKEAVVDAGCAVFINNVPPGMDMLRDLYAELRCMGILGLNIYRPGIPMELDSHPPTEELPPKLLAPAALGMNDDALVREDGYRELLLYIISGPDSDGEREAIHRHAVPRLRDLCIARRIRIIPVDARTDSPNADVPLVMRLAQVAMEENAMFIFIGTDKFEPPPPDTNVEVRVWLDREKESLPWSWLRDAPEDMSRLEYEIFHVLRMTDWLTDDECRVLTEDTDDEAGLEESSSDDSEPGGSFLWARGSNDGSPKKMGMLDRIRGRKGRGEDEYSDESTPQANGRRGGRARVSEGSDAGSSRAGSRAGGRSKERGNKASAKLKTGTVARNQLIKSLSTIQRFHFLAYAREGGWKDDVDVGYRSHFESKNEWEAERMASLWSALYAHPDVQVRKYPCRWGGVLDKGMLGGDYSKSKIAEWRLKGIEGGEGDLGTGGASKAVHKSMRSILSMASQPKQRDVRDVLHETLRAKSRRVPYLAGLEPLAAMVVEDIWARIEVEFPAHPKDYVGALEQPLEWGMRSQMRLYYPRAAEEKVILRCIKLGRPSALLLLGVEGSGMTSLMVRVARELRRQYHHQDDGAHDQVLCVTHFAGLSDCRRTIPGVLYSLCTQLAGHLQLHGPIPSSYNALQMTFRKMLKAVRHVSDRTRLAVLIDGVDELDNPLNLSWLPSESEIPTRVQIVCTISQITQSVSGTGTAKVLKALREQPEGGGRALEMMLLKLRCVAQFRALWPAAFGGALKMSEMKYHERKNFLLKFLRAAGLDLGEDRLGMLISKQEVTLPLYCTMLVREVGLATLWKDRQLIEDLPHRLDEMLDLVLEDCEELFGPGVVGTLLSCLVLSKGLTYFDILHVIKGKIDPGKHVYVEAELLEPEALDLPCGRGSRPPEGRAVLGARQSRWALRHAVEQLLRYARMGGMWEVATQVMNDLSFLRAKITLGMGEDLLQDFDDILDARRLPLPSQDQLEEGTAEQVNKDGRKSIGFGQGFQELAKGKRRLGRSKSAVNRATAFTHWCESRVEKGALAVLALQEMREFLVYGLRHLYDNERFPDLTLQVAANMPSSLVPAQHAQDEIDAARDLELQQAGAGAGAGRAEGDEGSGEGRREAITHVMLWRNKPPLLDRLLRSMEGHSEAVKSLKFAPGGQIIVSGSDDCTIRVWHARTGACGHVLAGHTHSVRGVAYLPNSKSGDLVVGGGMDSALNIWNISTGGTLANTCKGHSDGVTCVEVQRKTGVILTGSLDGTVRAWDVVESKELARMLGHTAAVTGITAAPHGDHFATSSWDKTVIIWSFMKGMEGGHRLFQLRGHLEGVMAVSFSPAGDFLATGSWDRTAGVWRTATGLRTGTGALYGHAGPVTGTAWSPTGGQLATCSWDGTARVWDAVSGKCLFTLEGGSRCRLHSLCFSPDGNDLLTGGEDGAIRVWTRIGHPMKLNSTLAASDDPARAACIWNNGTVYADRQQEDGTVKSETLSDDQCRHAGRVTGVTADSDGRFITCSEDCTIKLWAPFKDMVKPEADLNSHVRAVRGVDMAPGTHRVLSVSDDGNTLLWDLTICRELTSLSGHAGAVLSGSLSRDGNYCATGGKDKLVKLWAFENEGEVTGIEAGVMEGHVERVTSVCLSRDASVVASGSRDRTVRLWEWAGGRPLATLEGHLGEVTSVSFSQDDSLISSCSEDRTVRLWDARVGTAVGTLMGHGPMGCGQFHPTRPWFAATARGQMDVWDTRTWTTVARLPLDDGVSALAFGAGAEICCGDNVGRVYFLDLLKAPPAM